LELVNPIHIASEASEGFNMKRYRNPSYAELVSDLEEVGR
jgi:hypothetical protein